MLVFVEHQETQEEYLILGTGLGLYRSEDGFSKKEGVHKMLAVCDKSGTIYWYPSKKLTVITVDGKKVNDHWL